MTDEEVRSVSGIVRGYFLNRGVPVEYVDDAVQDVLLALLNAAGTIRCLSAYAIAVARNTRSAAIRSIIRERGTRCDVEAAGKVASGDDLPGIFEHSERRRLADALLLALPRLHRELLWRFYFAEQPVEGICAELGITRKKFELEKSRAKQRLTDRVSARCQASPRKASGPQSLREGAGLMSCQSSSACSPKKLTQAA